MKRIQIKIIIVLVAIATNTISIAQTPFNNFDTTQKSKQMLQLPQSVFKAVNEDTTNNVRYVELDKETLILKYLTKENTTITQVQLLPTDFKWLSVDPKAKEFPQWSPYNAMGDNPIRNIDPDGRKFLNFDQAGNYTGTTKDNWFHNFFAGTKGRVMNNDGSVQQKFKFADPKSDAKQIENGTINRLVFVNESDIKLMVSRSGGFDHDNKTANRGLSDRFSYIMAQGVGGGRMDFSYTQIPNVYPDASKTPIDPLTPSPLIFLVDGVAHNQMNFGNFMFGASGTAQGFFQGELLNGAHYRALTQGGADGYPMQFDSQDDQFSIQQGVNFANDHKYDKLEYKVKAGLLVPTTR